MCPVTLPIGNVFKGSNNRTVPCAYVSLISDGLLENLFQFTEKTRNVKIAFLRQLGAHKFGISGYCFLILQRFSLSRIFCFTLEAYFIVRRRQVYFKCAKPQM